MRLDLYLFNNNYVKSRQKAKGLIEGGNVMIDNKIVTKPAFEINEDQDYNIEITDDCKYVSRGGLKLEKILTVSDFDLNNKICVDIGSSTGGFTDCLLQFGAKRVYAIDSGKDQLDLSLKNNKKVFSIESFNAKNLNKEMFDELIDVVTIDVSFISQTLIMPQIFSILSDGGSFISLIKPQFEAGRERIGKGGIVKDSKSRLFAVNKVIECAEAFGYRSTCFIKSPIKGGDGNIEYLSIFEKVDNGISKDYIKKLILSQWG